MDLSTQPLTTYHERKIGKTLIRVTSVYTGKIDLAKALEDLAVKRILRDENASKAQRVSAASCTTITTTIPRPLQATI